MQQNKQYEAFNKLLQDTIDRFAKDIEEFKDGWLKVMNEALRDMSEQCTKLISPARSELKKKTRGMPRRKYNKKKKEKGKQR